MTASGGRRAAAALVVAIVAAAEFSVADDGAAPPASGRPEQDAAFDGAVDAAFAPFVPKLEALGSWCEPATLLIQRARVAECLVALRPDHERARAWLRYKRQKTGAWFLTSTKPFFDETPENTLFAYALSAYFLEGRPEDARGLLVAIGSGMEFHRALGEVCRLDADALEERFVRWLRETK